MNIRRRLMFSFVMLSFVPIVFISAFSFVNTYKDSIRKNEEYSFNVSYQITRNIDYLFDKYVDKLERIANHNTILADVYNYTQNEEYRNTAAEGRVKLTMESIAGREEGIDAVTIYSEKGYRFNYGNPVLGEDSFFNSILYAPIREGEVIWSVLGAGSKNADRLYITLAKKIRLRYDQKEKAVVVMYIKREYIDEVCKKIASKDNHYVVITNEKGLVISHPDINKVLKPYDTEIAAGITPGEMGGTDGSGTYNRRMVSSGNEKLWLYYDVLERNNWRVFNVFPNAYLMRSTVENGRVIMLITFVFILLSFSFILLVTKSIRSPLVNLITKMEKVGKGDLDVEILESEDGIEDEHTYLSQGLNDMTRRLKVLIEDVYHSKIREKELEFLIKEAELNALQQRINPHFLNNVLEAIFWSTQMKGYDEIGEMITALGNFLRTSINKGLDYITIHDEIENVKNYVYLQGLRFGNRFSVEWDIEKDVENYKTVKLILQPIIENAIVHGLKNVESGGIISIQCRKENDRIHFVIFDSGIGMRPEEVKNIQEYIDNPAKNALKSVGIKNVNQRIKLYFGIEYGIRIESEYQKGTEVTITLPALTNEPLSHFQTDGEVSSNHV